MILAGLAGLIGTRGIAGMVAVRTWDAPEGRCGGPGWVGGTGATCSTEDGVVGCVELASASDGGCEVVGVSMSDGTATVDAWDWVVNSVDFKSAPSAGFDFPTSTFSSVTFSSRAGKAKPSAVDATNGRRLLLCFEALGGNDSFGTDSQGNSG